MSNRRFNQFFNTLHKAPVLLDCNFVVAAGNANGITGLKGAGIQAVYMHTTTTPSAGNPNPVSGFAIVQLQDNYNRYFAGFHGMVSPQSGASLLVASAGLTVGQVYVITILGTTSTAQWHALGVPAGTTPAVGVPFVAAATAATGTGAVQLPKSNGSGIEVIDTIGNSNLTIQSTTGNIMGVVSGSYIIVRFLAATAAGNTALIATAPSDGSEIHLSFYLSNSAILVQGE